MHLTQQAENKVTTFHPGCSSWGCQVPSLSTSFTWMLPWLLWLFQEALLLQCSPPLSCMRAPFPMLGSASHTFTQFYMRANGQDKRVGSAVFSRRRPGHTGQEGSHTAPCWLLKWTWPHAALVHTVWAVFLHGTERTVFDSQARDASLWREINTISREKPFGSHCLPEPINLST